MKYKRDFLSKAICEIRYDPILRLENERPAEIQELCEDILPKLTPRENIEVKNVLSADAQISTEIAKRYQEWVFHNDENGSSLIIGPAQLRYQQQEYAGEEGFFQDFNFIWQAFRDLYGVETLLRVGLRYVNQITPGEGNPLDWTGMVSQSVVDAAIGVVGDLRNNISKSDHELRLTFEDHMLTVRFGLLNDDFPNPVAERAFLLDFDCYSGGPTEANDLLDNLAAYHLEIERHFERCIDEELRVLMGIVEDTRRN